MGLELCQRLWGVLNEMDKALAAMLDDLHIEISQITKAALSHESQERSEKNPECASQANGELKAEVNRKTKSDSKHYSKAGLAVKSQHG